MKVVVSGVVYVDEDNSLPKYFEFDVADEIANDDKNLSSEVVKLIKQNTNNSIKLCTIDVD
jgi:hypothetical protein